MTQGKLFLIDFSSFDKIFVHLKLQTCFVVPRLLSAIRSFRKMSLKLNEFEAMICEISGIQNTTIPMFFLENSEDEKPGNDTGRPHNLRFSFLTSVFFNQHILTLRKSQLQKRHF